LTTAFELQFRPSAALITIVRRFVSEFYERVLHDPDCVARVALATHELLENAVKYSLDGTTALSITVEPEAEAGFAVRAPPDCASHVAIRLSNRAAGEDIEALQALFVEMEAYPDPFAHYQAALARGAKSRVGSGLGIVRVRAEGEMSMSYTIDGDGVCIVARTRVQARRSS
jgi:hypothetical protein